MKHISFSILIGVLVVALGPSLALAYEDKKQEPVNHSGKAPTGDAQAPTPQPAAAQQPDVCVDGGNAPLEHCASRKLNELAERAEEIFAQDTKSLEEIRELQTKLANGRREIDEAKKELFRARMEKEQELADREANLPSAKGEPAPPSEQQGGQGGGGSGGGGGGGGDKGTKIPEFAQLPEPKGFQMPSPVADVTPPALPSIGSNNSGPIDRVSSMPFSNSNPFPNNLLQAVQQAGPAGNSSKQPLNLSPMAMATGEGFKNLGNRSGLSPMGPATAGLGNGFGGGGYGGGGYGGGGAGGGGAPGTSIGGAVPNVGEEGGAPPDEASGIKAREMAAGTGGGGGSDSGALAGAAGAAQTAEEAAGGKGRLAQAAIRAGETRDARPDPRARGAKTVFAALEVAINETLESGSVQLRQISSVRKNNNRSIASY